MAASAEALALPVTEPRLIDPGLPRSDRVFRNVVRVIGLFVLLLTSAIGLFLGAQAIPTLRKYGLGYFTETQWEPRTNTVGIGAVFVGTIEVALVALAVGFPLVDLMAAVPSIIYGLWGFAVLQPHAIHLSRWLATYFGWIPIFHVDTDASAAQWQQTSFTASAFIAGLAVSLMVIPLACAVMRGVFALAPLGEREAAFALGSTRWGMVRTVVLPFGRGGIIGGTMLALGRALGETIAVLLIISSSFDIKWNILSVGTNTFSALIAGRFGDATATQLSALLTAGFVLFAMTIAINSVAAIFVNRSRSGAATEI